MSPELVGIVTVGIGMITVGIGIAGLVVMLFQSLRREVLSTYSNLEKVMNARFDAQDKRFDAQDKRMDGQDKRMDIQDKRMDRMEDHLERIDGRLGNIEQNTAALIADMQTIKAHLLPSRRSADDPDPVARRAASD